MKTLEEVIKQLIPEQTDISPQADTRSDNDVAAVATPTIEGGYKVGYKGGRCWNGAHRDAGTVNHALPSDACDTSFDKALCGVTPGSRSYGWVMARERQVVTCKRCLAKMDAEDKWKLGKLSKQEVVFIRHALNIKFFGTGSSGDDYDVWQNLVERGLATKRVPPSWVTDDFVFFPTDAVLPYLETEKTYKFSDSNVQELRGKIAGMVGINYENGYWREAPRSEVERYAEEYMVWTGKYWRWPTSDEFNSRSNSRARARRGES